MKRKNIELDKEVIIKIITYWVKEQEEISWEANLMEENNYDKNIEMINMEDTNMKGNKIDDTIVSKNVDTKGKTDTNRTIVEISKETQPLSLAQSFLLIVILAIPIANIIFLFRWAFGKGVNYNKRNIARALLIIMVLSFLFYYFGQQVIGSLS